MCGAYGLLSGLSDSLPEQVALALLISCSGCSGGEMKHISDAISGILIKAALSADTKSERKERLYQLRDNNIINDESLAYCLKQGGLL